MLAHSELKFMLMPRRKKMFKKGIFCLYGYFCNFKFKLTMRCLFKISNLFKILLKCNK